MRQSTEDICQNLKDCGFPEEQIERGISLIEAGSVEEAEKYLRFLRCGLMDELHDSQARVDRLDFLIYSLKKNQK